MPDLQREAVRARKPFENQHLPLTVGRRPKHGMDVASGLATGDFRTANTRTDVDYTHYDFLDLPPGASTARVEAAYQMIKQRFSGSGDEELVRMIHRAYAVLSDAERRHAYDSELERVAAAADAELKAALDAQGPQAPRRVQDIPLPLLTALSAWAA